ncbi:mechanosensitive ion channel family protein [Sporosarcina cascadiensis]|uniref:mechanosensitive ion channel family protein n=1 Tax=Sporosarcina cascadiensis TaxID=2660747 RepID=UPI00129B8A15|nr:mechanosensitive ion channel domain-containing protein [Sporosarcina cascadiensis]
MPEFLTEYFSGLADGLSSTLKTPGAYLNKIALSAVILLIGLFLHSVCKKMITSNVHDMKRRYQLRKATKQGILTLTVIAVLFIWVQAINALILISLLIGVFVVFMVRGMTTNIIGYFVMKYQQYLEVGHRIEINGIIGDVIDINPVFIKLLEVRNNLSSDSHTGRLIKLPNSIIFDESMKLIGVKNEFLWHEIKYTLAFDSDWQAAEKIMTDAGNRYFEEMLVPLIGKNFTLSEEKERLQPVFSVDTNDAGIILTLRYAADYRNGTSMKTALQREMLAKISENERIAFASFDVRIFPE